MPSLPETMVEFIKSMHVLSLAVLDREGLWSANCFYAFDAEQAALVILTSLDTRHGTAMRDHPHISGTISAQPSNIRDIRGIQFSAIAERLENTARYDALSLYTSRHPLAKLKKTDVWYLQLQQLKFTDNRYLFGHKTHWNRSAGEA